MYIYIYDMKLYVMKLGKWHVILVEVFENDVYQ